MESKINSIISMAIFTMSVLWYNNANAADKTESFKGTITLGATGYGIKLENGKVIGFMGHGGNKVFATCHNGDACEITGIVAYNIKNPLFITVKSVHKLHSADKAITNSNSSNPPAIKAEGSAEKSDQIAPPALASDEAAHSTPAESAIKPTEQTTLPAAEPDNSSPFLLDGSASQ